MIRIRALNEADDNIELEHHRGPAKETQEQEALALYKNALQLLADSQVQSATEILEALLESPYLKNEENKKSCPLQVQVRLGCLKSLGTVYYSICPNPEEAVRVLMEATEMDPKNINLWHRLGVVAMKVADYDLAKTSFYQALKLNPVHWSCIENIITVSYVLNDYRDCLYYCAYGIEKDPNFLRGIVVKDHIFESLPHLKESLPSTIPNYEKLSVPKCYDDKWKRLYLGEVQDLLKNQRKKILEQKSCSAKVLSSDCSGVKSLSDLCRLVRILFMKMQNKGIVNNVIELVGLNIPSCQNLETSGQLVADNDDKDMSNDVSLPSITITRRSSSDDKDTGVSNGESGTEMTDDKSPEEETSQSTSAREGKKARKKSKKDVKWWQLEGKRRSQRVRGYLVMPNQSNLVKEHNFGDRLRSIIPEALLILDETESSNAKRIASNGELLCDVQKKYFGTDAEAEDIRMIAKLYGKSTITKLLTGLVNLLAKMTDLEWPIVFVSEYLKLFEVYRGFYSRPTSYDLNEASKEWLHTDCLLNLTRLEIVVEKISQFQSDELRSDERIMGDMIYISELLSKLDDKILLVRFHWLLAKYYMALANRNEAVFEDSLHHLLVVNDTLKTMPENHKFLLRVPVKIDNIITTDTVQKKVHFVRNLENMGRVTELYKLKRYEELIDILNFCIKSGEVKQRELTHRYYLAEAYFKTDKLPEALEQSLKIISWCLKYRESNEEVLSCSVELVEKICNSCSSEMISVKLKKQVLMSMVDVLTANDQKHFQSGAVWTLPWCITHNILQKVEHQEPLVYVFEDSVPSSIVLLKFAHEYLSQYNKCLEHNGRLLFYTLDVLIGSTLPEEYADYEETKHCIEQTVFCLYNHPTKKTKHRYLNDHNSLGIELELAKCEQLLCYYKPLEIPEFDSFDSTSAETEALYQRMLAAIPEDLKPFSGYTHLCDFLKGKLDDPDVALLGTTNFPSLFKDIYYLIGDHHFKSKEWVKGVEFYTWDLALNLKRFDSWAAIALAKAEMINSSLNSCDNIIVEDVTFRANIVVKCFRKALELQPSNSKVRIEFGSFAYAIHAICSRLLKKTSNYLTAEKLCSLQAQKTFFLCVAIKCFEPGIQKLNFDQHDADELESQQEVWIHHYMLGKVTEKLEPENPRKFLSQYETAGQLLHEQGASYPAKLNFNTAPDLAIEALEIYYRIHASIMTYIERYNHNEDIEKTLQKFISRAAESPFMKSKVVRGDGGDSKRRRTKEKDVVLINQLLVELVNRAATLVEQEISSQSQSTRTTPCSSPSSSSSWDTWVQSPMESTRPPITSYGLSDFCQKLKQDEEATKRREEEAAKLRELEEKQRRENETKQIMEVNPHFLDSKYCRIITQCVKAFEECLSRFSSHHKSYFRISYTYFKFGKDSLQLCRNWLIRSPEKKQLPGLFGDRRPNNLFNGIWRTPVEDIDRPGSFPYHMAKAVNHLLDVLRSSSDHETLADLAVQLSKVPEPDKQYLYNSDREHFAVEAVKYCISAAKDFFDQTRHNSFNAGISVFQSFVKLQKLNCKENALAGLLLEVYKLHMESQNLDTYSATVDTAFRYFQHLTWSTKIQQGHSKLGPGRVPNIIQDKNKLMAIKRIANTAMKSVKPTVSIPVTCHSHPNSVNPKAVNREEPPNKISKSGSTLNSALTEFYAFQKRLVDQHMPPLSPPDVSNPPTASGTEGSSALGNRIKPISSVQPPAQSICSSTILQPCLSSSMNVSRHLNSVSSFYRSKSNSTTTDKIIVKPKRLDIMKGNSTSNRNHAKNPDLSNPASRSYHYRQENFKLDSDRCRSASPAPYPIVKFNTSPFRAQSNIMRSPKEELNGNRVEKDPLAITPPKAHCYVHQPNPYFTNRDDNSSDSDIEIIDLTTTKSPSTETRPTVLRKIPPETSLIRENGHFPGKSGPIACALTCENLSSLSSLVPGTSMQTCSLYEGSKVLPTQSDNVTQKVYPLPPKKKRIVLDLFSEEQSANCTVNSQGNISDRSIDIITLD